MPLVLTPLSDGPAAPRAIDLGGIVPDRVAGLGLADVAALPVVADGRPCRVGDLFAVTGDTSDAAIDCRGDFARVHFVAAGMQSGVVRVTGHVGRHAGEGMSGGRLEVGGAAGDWLAAQIAGGQVIVAGDAGHNVAAAWWPWRATAAPGRRSRCGRARSPWPADSGPIPAWACVGVRCSP